MGEFARGAAGRRLFSPEFKKQQIGRALRGEITLAELTRELDISPSVTRRSKRLFEQRGSAAMSANVDVVPARRLREAEQRIRELERALGRTVLEVEILQAAPEEVRPRPSWSGVSRP